MKRIRVTPDEDGQITLPEEVLKTFGVEPGDFITFVVDETGKVTLTKAKFSVADLKGILPALDPPPSADFDAEIDEAMADMADRVLGGTRTA